MLRQNQQHVREHRERSVHGCRNNMARGVAHVHDSEHVLALLALVLQHSRQHALPLNGDFAGIQCRTLFFCGDYKFRTHLHNISPNGTSSGFPPGHAKNLWHVPQDRE